MRQQSRTVLNQQSTTGRAHVANSLLTDQQNKHSDSYQQGKQNTDGERDNRMPSGLDLFRLSAFLRRPDTQPEEKFVHSSQPIIGAALWWPYYAYDYDEFPYSASAKSPNPGQGCPERQRLER
jgi:hypothetical protein